MFRYEEFEEEDFLLFLHQGLFDEDINTVVSKYPFYSAKIQFELIKYLRKRKPLNLSLKTLSKALSVSQKDARIILQAEGKEFKIPLSSDEISEEGQLIRALVIPGTSKIITNNEFVKRALVEIKKFLKTNFAVFFEKSFTGKSFMLPLATALYIKNIPEDLVFTGKINSSGEIFEVDNIDKKLFLCQRLGYRLCVPSQVGHINTIKVFLEKKKWSIPLYITCEDKKELQNFLKDIPEEKTSEEISYFDGLDIFYGIKKEDLCLSTGQLKTSEDFIKACYNFYQTKEFIKIRLSGEKVFHIGIRGPTSLAFALGIVFGSQDPFIIYHYHEGKYYPVKVLNPREIKERLDSYTAVKYTLEKRGDDLCILFRFAHHEMLADVKKYAESFLNKPSFLILSHSSSGNVPLEEFKKVSQEAGSIIQDIRSKHSFKSFHFFFSSPVVIAFMLGVIFGHYSEGAIYNYQKAESNYLKVINLSDLRKIREGDVRF